VSKKLINVPLGSQHISLLEPVRFKFQTENETIVGVDADVGFVHRGIEKACTTKFEYKQVGYVVARVCGLCAITHSLAYSMAVEELLGVEVSERVKYLRLLMVELDRIHSHMLCLAHVAESGGYEALFMKVLNDREIIMSAQERISGNRVQFDYIALGGVNRDIDDELITYIQNAIDTLRPKIDELYHEYSTNWSVGLKYKGVGILTKDDALRYNALGPLARASGVATDVRAESSALPYKEAGFEIRTREGGDVYDRNLLRLDEIKVSLTMCENIIHNLPTGEIITKIKGKPEGETIARLEAPRGEILYYLKASKKAILDRVRIKTPTFAGVPAMTRTFKGEEYANAPAILASFDPCMSCTAK
jgi:ech hydrogenase subunit E